MIDQLKENSQIKHSELAAKVAYNQFAKNQLLLNMTPISNIETIKSLSLGKSISLNTQLPCKKEKQIVVTTCTKQKQNKLFSYSFIGGIKINQISRQEKPKKKTTYYTPQIMKSDQFAFDCEPEEEDNDW